MQAFAADIRASDKNVTRKQIFEFIVAKGLPYDQVIFEGTWVHVGRRSPSGSVRQEKLMMFPGSDGKPDYFQYDPADPRTNT